MIHIYIIYWIEKIQLRKTPIKKVLIWGGGNFGSRWLQGFLQWNNDLNICIYDPSPKALNLCKERASEVYPTKNHKIQYCHLDTSTFTCYDLVIVCTTADIRCKVIEGLVHHIKTHYWILEKVLGQSEEQILRINKALSDQKVWVNTPRRSWIWYKKLKKLHPIKTPTVVKINGGQWDLLGNLIHYLDLISWWLEAEIIDIDTSNLNPNWQISDTRTKSRSDTRFYDADGEISVLFNGQHSLTICWKKSDNVKITFNSDKTNLVIDEVKGTSSSYKKPSISGKMEHQSRSTSELLYMLESTGETDLPSLKISSNIHVKMLKALLKNKKSIASVYKNIIPIS